jgi:hypothetical protein
MNKQLRVHQQNFKDASYQNSNYSMVYGNPDKNVRSDLDKSVKTKVVTVDTAPGAILGAGLSLKMVGTTLTYAGTGYYGSVPSVTISGGGGSAAAITASVENGVVSGLTITNAGSGYTSVPTLAIAAPPAADQATATAEHHSSLFVTHAYSVTNDGAGHTSAPTVSISAPNAVTAVVSISTINASGAITKTSVDNGGSGYTTAPSTANGAITVSTETGSNFVASAVFSGTGIIGSINITNEGSNYDSEDTITISAPTKTQATATAVLDGHVVDSINVTNAGAGYVSTPTVTIAAQSITTATATATMGLTGSISITYEGKGYTTAPTVTVDNTGTDGSGGVVTAVLSGDTVASASVTTAGTGYTSLPSLSVAAPATTKFKENLIEPLIVDRLSDVFLDSFTTFNCKANTSSDSSAFILDIEEFNIHSNSNNSKLAFNKCVIPNLATTATQITIHKGKKFNYICSINPCRLRTLTLDATILDGSTINAAGGRYIAEFVIKPQAIKK